MTLVLHQGRRNSINSEVDDSYRFMEIDEQFERSAGASRTHEEPSKGVKKIVTEKTDPKVQEKLETASQKLEIANNRLRFMKEREKNLDEAIQAITRDYQQALREQRAAMEHGLQEQIQMKIDRIQAQAQAREEELQQQFELKLREAEAMREREMASLEARWQQKSKHGIQPDDRSDNTIINASKQPNRDKGAASKQVFSMKRHLAMLRQKHGVNKSCAPVLIARETNEDSTLESGNTTTDDPMDSKKLPSSDSSDEDSDHRTDDSDRTTDDSNRGTDESSDSSTEDDHKSSRKKPKKQHRSSRGREEHLVDMVATLLDAVTSNKKRTGEKGEKRRPCRGRKPKLDEEVRRQREDEGSVRLVFLEHCRTTFKEKFGIEGDDDFMGHESADPKLVSAHKAGIGGPDKANLHFDMRHGSESEWNRAVIKILVSKVERIHRRSRYKKVKRTDAYFEDLVSEKYKHVRAIWRTGQLRITDDNVPETAEQMEARVLKQKERQLTNNWTRERRVAKYERRMQTVSETIDCKEQEHAADVGNWVWLKSVLEMLGTEGMSSEESEAEREDIEVTYRPRIMPWRHNLDNEFKLIDTEHRRLVYTHSRRGARPALRKRDEKNGESTRPPMAKLPLSFYDENWLSKKSVEYVERTLKPPRKQFKWRELKIA